MKLPPTRSGATAPEPGLRATVLSPALPVQERDLAGYALHRSLQGEALDGPQMSDLRRAQQAMAMTRSALHHGRGNVTQDIERDPTVMSRTHAVRVSIQNVAGEMDRISANAMRTAAARLAGAGMCHEFTNSTNHHYMATMPAQESTTMVHSSQLRHVWLEARSANRPAVVMDAWRSGPAVLAKDSANHAVKDHEDSLTYTAPTAREALQRLGEIDRVMVSPGPGSRNPLPHRARQLAADQQKVLVLDSVAGYAIPVSNRFPDSSTLSPGFATRAQAAWDRPSDSSHPPDLRREVQAASVASTWAPGVGERSRLAGDVVRAAHDLLQLPQPPLEAFAAPQHSSGSSDSSSAGSGSGSDSSSDNPPPHASSPQRPVSSWNSSNDSDSDVPDSPRLTRPKLPVFWDSNTDSSDNDGANNSRPGCLPS